jgi:hypothetical protein
MSTLLERPCDRHNRATGGTPQKICDRDGSCVSIMRIIYVVSNLISPISILKNHFVACFKHCNVCWCDTYTWLYTCVACCNISNTFWKIPIVCLESSNVCLCPSKRCPPSGALISLAWERLQKRVPCRVGRVPTRHGVYLCPPGGGIKDIIFRQTRSLCRLTDRSLSYAIL